MAMNRAFRAAAPVAAGIVGMALLSGCGTDASAVPAAKPSLPAAYPTSTAFTGVLQMKFPDDAYEQGASQTAEIEYLNLRLTQHCMDEYGFNYLPTLSTAMIAQSTKVNDEAQTRRYGISDPVAAAVYGYHLPSWVNGSASGETISQLPAAERAVLQGQGTKTYDGRAVPSGGCQGQTAGQLSAAGLAGTDLQQNDGSDPAGSLPHQIELDAFQAAQHDITCELRTNLLDVEYSVESGYQAAAIAQNAQAMAQAKTQLGKEITALNGLMKEYAE